MSKNNVRIAIRDSTDSHNVAFFDNVSGIRYQSANLHRFLAGSASILTIKYNSKDIDSIRSGCKLAFRYKNRDYWLNVMSFEKKGFEVELTAYSLGLELNNETRGEHKPANAMSIAEYVAYYDPEHALTIGVNEVSDKRIKLEWTGTDTILARLFSVANSFGAELDFNVELNDDYSLKRQVLNIYKKGNLGTNKVSQPVRVGKELKVINYSDNIKELRTAVRATGKDGLTIDGLNKKIYDNNKELLYYSSGMTVYAPQSRDRFPSVGKGSNDNWIVKDLGETQYETKEALWGYMYGEIQKISVPEITYEVEGAIDAGIGDTQTLIDDIHFEPALYVQARVSELEDDILTGKVTNSTFINFERKYSQIADSLLKQVEALAEDAAPYIVRLSTDNGYNFKNGQGTSTITAKLEKYSKIVNAKWKWLINNSVVSETSSVKINASQVNGTLNVVAVAIVGGNEAAREYITFTNADDGVGIKSITRYYTTNDQAEGVTAGGQNWSTKPTTPTVDKKYMWSYDVITYTNDTSLVTKPAVIGARGDDGLDADTTGITEALDKAKQELTALSANIEKVRNDSLAAVEEAKQQLTTVANDLSKAKADLQNAVSAVDTKATNLQSDLTEAKQDLTSQAQQLQAQASAQSELTKRVSSVEKTANGTKTTVSELSKTVDSNTKNITSVTARTKVVEDDLSGTKTTLSQVQTTANSASQKTATLETGLNGLTAKFDNLKIGAVNLLKNTKSFTGSNISGSGTILSETYQGCAVRYLKSNTATSGHQEIAQFNNCVYPKLGGEYVASFWAKGSGTFTTYFYGNNGYLQVASIETSQGKTGISSDGYINFTLSGDWQRYWIKYKLKTEPASATSVAKRFLIRHFSNGKEEEIWLAGCKLEEGNVATDYSPNDADLEQKVAEYKQTADQNYASLQTTVQNLDGTVQQNKTVAEQTAAGFKTRIESLETYKSGESTRANQYFELAKTETARQLTVERTAIAKDYVAKSTYTSDVTGIRNELSATTSTANATKTNLANYQASNDKVVASLKSSLQTTDGNVSNLQTKVEAVPGQITSAVSAVESKIPKSVGSVNLFKGSRDFSGTGWANNSTGVYAEDYQGVKIFKKQTLWSGVSQYFEVKTGEEYVFSAYVKSSAKTDNVGFYLTHSSKQPVATGLVSFGSVSNQDSVYFELTDNYKRIAIKIKITKDGWIMPRLERSNSDAYLFFGGYKLERGIIATDWSPAPEDYDSDITKLNTTLTQTANGLEQLSTQVTSQGSTIISHTNSINSLTTGLSAKVSQTDFNTLSGRVTTAENNITAKANELSSKITSVEGKIPTSASQRNLVQGTSVAWSPFVNITTNSNWCYDLATVNYGDKTGIYAGSTINIFVHLSADEIVLNSSINPRIFMQGTIINKSGTETWTGWDKYHPFYNKWSSNLVSGNNYRIVKLSAKVSNDSYSNINGFKIGIRIDGAQSGKFHHRALMVTTGDVFPDSWSAAPEDAINQINSLSSEFKQTTDAIKASVTSLDNSTVKNSSLTINADGIVMKAGKSTTDVANAIGSYFSVNQNAINLFSDKIKVKGSMIVSGSISSDKIVSSGITANVIKGGTLQSLNGSTNFELDTGKLFYNNNNTGVFRIQKGASTMGLKFSNTPVTVNGTSRILSRVILGGDRRETTLDDGKWDQGGFTGIVAETINGVDSNSHSQADTLRVIGDNIYFTHSYNYDAVSSTSAHGWKMETFSPFSTYTGHVVLKPYGINYRQSDIVTGDVRLDNGDGSGYWVRACIRTLRNCFQHYLNGGTSSGAMNAIRDALKEISGV